MTESLPPEPAVFGEGRANTYRPTTRDRVVGVLGGVSLQSMPHMPERVKRALLGGKSITIDGNTLDATLQLMLAGSRLSGAEGLILSTDPVIARIKLDAVAAQFPKPDVDITWTDITLTGPAGDIPTRHYRPKDDNAPLLVFYHGGGFVVGGLETHGHLAEVICRDAGVHVLFPDYRLAPEHKAPAAYDDAYAVYLWARDHAAELGADTSRVAVGGDSAGGNLAAGVAIRARDEGAPPPVFQLLLYPVCNLAGHTRSYDLFAHGFFLTRRDMDFCNEQYVGGSGIDPADPRVSPLLADDLSGLPPALLAFGGFDPMRDEDRAFGDALRAAGNDVDQREYGSLIHSFPNFSVLGGESLRATGEIISALRAHLSRS
jgi:acetyl esterase/lipase